MSKLIKLRDLIVHQLYLNNAVFLKKNSTVAQLGFEPMCVSDVKPLRAWRVIKRPPFLAGDIKSVYTAPPPGIFPVPLPHCGIASLSASPTPHFLPLSGFVSGSFLHLGTFPGAFPYTVLRICCPSAGFQPGWVWLWPRMVPLPLWASDSSSEY